MRATLARLVVPAVGCLLAMMFGMPAASAHVTVQPGSLPKGASDVVLSFAAPNERTNANVVGLDVALPTATPIVSVYALGIPGWNVTVQSVTLVKPVKTDDGTITQAVSRITWTTSGAGIPPNQFGLFTVLAGALPTKPSSLAFQALQTYSDGQVVRWIEPIVKGAPAPEHPTPILRLTARQK